MSLKSGFSVPGEETETVIGISTARPRRFFLFVFYQPVESVQVGRWVILAPDFGRRLEILLAELLKFLKQSFSLLPVLPVCHNYIAPFSPPIRVLGCEILYRNQDRIQ